MSNESKNEARRNLRALRISEGNCSECGNPRGKDGTSSKCRKCADLQLNRSKRKARDYVDSGKCYCGKEKSPYYYRCPECTEKHKIASRDLRKRRVEGSKCVRCGRPIIEREGVTKCINCMEEIFGFRWD